MNDSRLTPELVRDCIDRGRQYLLSGHQGGVEIHSVQGHCVRIRFTGNCRSCMSASESLVGQIEDYLRKELATPDLELRVYTGVSEALIQEAKKILNKHQ